MNPARKCLESLDRRPGIREQPRSHSDFEPRYSRVCSSPNSGPRLGRFGMSEKCHLRTSSFFGVRHSSLLATRQRSLRWRSRGLNYIAPNRTIDPRNAARPDRSMIR
jgi:hypothetical protein